MTTVNSGIGEFSAGDSVDLNGTNGGVSDDINTGELTLIHTETDSVLLRTTID